MEDDNVVLTKLSAQIEKEISLYKYFDDYNFVKAVCSMNTFFIDRLYFQKFLKKYDSFCLKYDIFDATG